MTALHDFIYESNDIGVLRELLISGENPNYEYPTRLTPLRRAILKSVMQPEDSDEILLIARELIHFGANVNLKDNKATTPLHLAVAHHKYSIVEMLLQQNADVNQEDNEGYAALHYAISGSRFPRTPRYPDLEVVKLLLKYNPEIDKQTQKGETALMLAVQSDNIQIVRELLHNNASGNLQNINGDSALDYALKRRSVYANIVLELVRGGCPFNAVNQPDLRLLTSYLLELLTAPDRDAEKAKFLAKLFMLDKNSFNALEKRLIKEVSEQYQLDGFILMCYREIEQMKADALLPNFNAYDIALHGPQYSVLETNNHIPLEACDRILDKLIKRQYPLYCDLIAKGICRPYMKRKFADWLCNINMGNNKFSSDVFFQLSYYLSNLDMLNIMIAVSRRKKRSWFLQCFMYPTRCSVS